jgi:peptide/nickel transport system substrate-binding protein
MASRGFVQTAHGENGADIASVLWPAARALPAGCQGAARMVASSIPPGLTRRGALALGLAATLPVGAARAASGGGTIRVAYPAPVATLDPAKFRVGGLEYNYANCVFSRLTKQDNALQVIPDLATSWQASADLRSWTFHLRPGVQFHDGAPFTAADVLFTYARLQDKAVASVLRANLAIVEHVEMIDPLTVRFALSIPYADLPAVVAGYQAMIVSEASIGGITTHPIGTGPFRFVEYRPGDQMVLEKNPHYFLPGLPKLDRAVLRIIPEYTTAVAALESGAIDLIYDLPPEQVDVVKRNGVAEVMQVPSGTWQGIVMNNTVKPFDDARVRRAFLKLVDKPAFTDIATFGQGTPTVTPLPPTHPFFRHDIPLGADIPGARALLAEAGMANGFSIEMFVPGESPPMERLATAFRDAAKQVKIDVRLRVVPQDKFFAEMEGKVPLNIDNFFGRATPDLMLYPWYHSTGSWNNTLWHYKNAEIDQILDAARSSSDKAEQAKLYGRFQAIIAEDGPGSVVYVQDFACGVSRKLRDFSPSPLMFADISAVSLGG